MNVAFPFGFDGHGRTASVSEDEHIRDMIELVLFTSPGERPFRPTFGSGLLNLVFGPNGDALASTAQLSVQGALQQWLGELIQVEEVAVDTDDAALNVVVRYIVRRGGQRRVASYTRARP